MEYCNLWRNRYCVITWVWLIYLNYIIELCLKRIYFHDTLCECVSESKVECWIFFSEKNLKYLMHWNLIRKCFNFPHLCKPGFPLASEKLLVLIVSRHQNLWRIGKKLYNYKPASPYFEHQESKTYLKWWSC